MSAASLVGFTVSYFPEEDHGQRRPRRNAARGQSTSSIISAADHNRRKVIDDLLELRMLRSDWDGEGAAAPIPELIDSAIRFVDSRDWSDPPTRVVPVNDGRVTLEWDKDGYFLSLRIEAPDQARQMLVKADGTTEFSRFTLPSGSVG